MSDIIEYRTNAGKVWLSISISEGLKMKTFSFESCKIAAREDNKSAIAVCSIMRKIAEEDNK